MTLPSSSEAKETHASTHFWAGRSVAKRVLVGGLLGAAALPLAVLQSGGADAVGLLFSLPAGLLIGSSLAYFTYRFRRYGTWKRWIAAGGTTGLLAGALAVDFAGAPVWFIPVGGLLGVIFTVCFLAEWHR